MLGHLLVALEDFLGANESSGTFLMGSFICAVLCVLFF